MLTEISLVIGVTSLFCNLYVNNKQHTRSLNADKKCPTDLDTECGDGASKECQGEFFPDIPRIKHEGPTSKNPLSYKWYNPDEEILGKKMKDWMRFSAAFWHTFRGTGDVPFGALTKSWSLEDGTNSIAMSKRRMRAHFEFISRLGVDRWYFHGRDIARDGKTLATTCLAG